ncbi:DUF1365 domain-containing protein [Halochromatium roseum]|uniref:DUF1365 domain-containing protein n=1 Tax=Halochromatium roseum TaxID=391920 RepID=UPI001911E605|nr:DUF1365 domain-containing protein [Halochromatium roseum]MBK5942100.1 hypothetical protein [Halochromatium roseum]
MSENPHRIYFTQVMHRRLFPVQYRFTYKVFSLLLDLDALDRVPSLLRTRKGFGLLRFAAEDHGPRDGSALRPWADQLLREHGIELAGGRIRLLCMPRVLGYGFNPLSLWYCEHADGQLRAVLAEVSNTFGDSHFYLLANGGKPLAWPVRDRASKCFYVSPLMEVAGEYRFRLAEPDKKIGVFIRQFHQDGRLELVATQSGAGEPLSNRALWRALRRTPLMSFKVMLAIHWQALKIWLRGARYVPKPDSAHPKVT